MSHRATPKRRRRSPLLPTLGGLALALASAPVSASAETTNLPFGEEVQIHGEVLRSDRQPESVSLRVQDPPSDTPFWLISTAHPPRVLPAGFDAEITFPWVRNTNFLTEPAGPELLQGDGPLTMGFEPRPGGSGTAGSFQPGETLRDPGGAELEPAFTTPVEVAGGDTMVRLAEQVAVEPGTDYLFRAFYRIRDWEFGANVICNVEVIGSDGSTYHKPPHFLQPRFTGPDEWVYVSVRFTTGADAERVQIRLGAENAPATVDWAGVSLREASSPLMQAPEILTDEEEPAVKTAEEVKAMLAGEEAVEAELRRVGGQPVLHVNGEPTESVFYNPNFYNWDNNYANLSGRLARDAGMKLHQITIALGDPAAGLDPASAQVWKADGVVDFTEIDRRIVEELRHAPDAYLRLNVAVDTYYDFGIEHPDAIFTLADGSHVIGWNHDAVSADRVKGDEENYAFSYASATLRDKAGEVMRQLGEHLATSDTGKRIIGIHMAVGSDGQWIATLDPHEKRDVSPEQVEGYRAWLKKKYGDDAGLREAWGDPEATLATARQAVWPEIAPEAPDRMFLQPDRGEDRRIIDSNVFQSEGKAETAIHFAERFDAGFGRESITTTYWSDVMHGHALDHWAVGTLLDSEHIDGLISIGDYGFWRDPGHTGGLSSLVGAFRLRNKLFIAEADHRSPMSWFNKDALDLREYLSSYTHPHQLPHVVRREWGQSFCLGGGAWYYALSGPAWADPLHTDWMKEATRVSRMIANAPALDTDRSAVATFADERSNDHMTQKNEFGIYVFQHSHNFARIPLNLSGLGFDPYLIQDIANPELPDYGIYVFLSANTMTEAQVEAAEALQRDGHVLVFLHAAGASGELGLTPTLERLTGMTVKLDAEAKTYYKYIATGSDLLADQIDHTVMGTPGPVLYVEDPEADGAVALARYDEEEGGRVAAAVKRHDDWTAVYLAAPGGVTPRLLRNLATEAGITIAGPENDATFTGNRMFVVHGMTTQPKTLRWDEPADLVNLTTEETVARNATSYEFELPVGETAWFRRMPVER